METKRRPGELTREHHQVKETNVKESVEGRSEQISTPGLAEGRVEC